MKRARNGSGLATLIGEDAARSSGLAGSTGLSGSSGSSAVNANLLMAMLVAVRPVQWVKNVVVFAGALFSGLAVDSRSMLHATIAALSFCLVSSATYVFNDLRDREADRRHPRKQLRPIAAGAISTPIASLLCAVTLAGGIALAASLGWLFSQVVAVYLATNVAYSLGLKRVVILDAMLVALGFVLRAVAGAVAVGVSASSWIVVCSLELAMLIVLGKRRADLLTAERGGARDSLPKEWYTLPILDHLMTASAGAAIVTYAMYTLDAETIFRIGSRRLVFTLPMVVYACLRYLFLAQSERTTDDPSTLFVTDVGLILSAVAWLAAVVFALY